MADGTYYTVSAIHSKSLKQLGDYEERKRLEVEQMLLEEWNSGWKLWGTEGLKTVEGFRGGSECSSQQAEHRVMQELNLDLIKFPRECYA